MNLMVCPQIQILQIIRINYDEYKKKTLLQTRFAPIINKSQQLITTQYILLLEWKVKKSKNLERYALN